jgi:hypothetical protein
MSLFRWL